MVSPISIPGFPSVHTRQSAAICDAALESRLASLEACVAALPSLITAAIDQAFADSLTQFRRDMFFRGAGEGISTPLAGDHHGSPAIDPIQVTRRPICAEGAQSQLSPSAVQAPPQLSSSPLLQALATSAVKPHSKDSAAATVLLPESKTGIHASTMTSAPRLLHEHSFPDTTKTGSTVLLLFGVIACYTGHSAFVYHAFLNAKYGWVNWYFVGKFVKKDFYALELFEEMSKRLNTYNMSLSSNLDAWDIVEDVAIAYEYNNITMRNQIPKSEPASLKPLTLNEFTELIRLEIAMNGFTEVLTFILGSWQEIFPMSSYKDDKDVAKLKEIGESFIIEGNPESCTSWLSMSGEVLASGDKLMYLPCGLAAGSSITVVGSSHYAYEEYVSQLAKLRWGDGTVMVAQFMDELLTHGGPPYDNIVVLVCRYLPKDLAASFTEENGTLGHINAIKQFLCLSLLHICAFTVMAISQLDYSIFTSLLSKLNQELCHRVDVHLDAVFFPHCVANDQIFQQPGWCHTLTDPCDNISYQRVVFNQRNKFNKRNYAKWSFKVVEENGKRKGFRFDHFDKEDSAMSAASALNDTISKGKDLYVSIFVQKSKNDNRLRIFFNTLNPALSQEVVCYKGLELATNITEACNNRVFGQIVLLLVHSFSDTTMIRLLEEYANLKGLQDGHFRQEGEVFAMLSHKHRNDPLKIREIISMVANSLTSLLNLEIEFKILLQDGTITASILFFLVYGMHFKEQWKSRTTPYVTVPEQHCVSHHVFSYVIGKRWILVELELHHKKTGRRIQMLTFGSEEEMSIIFVFARSLHICLTVSVSWQKELFKFLELDTTQPPYVFKCQLYTLTEVMKDMVEALCLLRSSKSSMHNIGVASDGLKFNDSERIAVFNIQYRLVPSISLFQKMEFYDNQTLGGPSITEKSYEMCFHEGKMTEKDITPMGGFPHCGVVKDGYIRSNEWCVGPKKMIVNLRQSLLNQTAQTARPALEDIKLRTISKAIILGNGPIAIVVALVENLLAGSLGVGPFSPFDAAKYFLATSMEIKMISCVEIYEEATDDKYLVAGTDGVGTKLKLAFDTGIHDTIGIDLVAMSVNDIVTSGAKPLFFLDYYATSRLDVDLAEKVVKGIVDGCQQSDCVLLGGETAEMPGFYADGEYDLSGFAVGTVNKDAVIDGKNIVAGDVLVGLPSSGVHSNGFSLVRRVLSHSSLSLKDQLPGEDITLGEALMAPTVIYVKQVLDIISKGGVKGIAHITGGGFTDNIPRVFPKGLGAVIYNGSWEVPAVFKWIQEAGRIEEAEMMRTFNMGVGMVLVVSREAAHRILEEANGANKAYRIGEVVRGEGVSYS